MAKKCRDYQNELPSVTEILSILRKIGLEMWYRKNTPEFINAEMAKGKQIGVELHDCIQAHIEEAEVKVETQYSEEVMNALKSFMLFKKEHPVITLKRSEIQMTSNKYGVNGTLDCVGNDGEEVILDWKSTNAKNDLIPPIYDEAIYQVSAYVKIYNEVNKAKIKKAYILALAKDKVAYNLKEINQKTINKSFKEVFMPSLSIWKYQKKGK